jgi:hypothetical protein
MKVRTASWTAVLVVLALVCTSFSVSASVSTTAKAKLETSGKLIVTGNSTVRGWEANLVRAALDSSIDNPSFNLLASGNSDGYVNASEAEFYAQKVVQTDILKNAFDIGVIKVEEDGKDIPAKLSALAFPDVSGIVASGNPLNVTFSVECTAKFSQEKDPHKYTMIISPKNVTFNVRFDAPSGWDISTVSGLKGKNIVNTDKQSYVTGTGSGDSTKVTIEIKKESGWCFLVLVMIIVIVVLIGVYIMFARHRSAREVSMKQPEHAQVPGQKDERIPGDKKSPKVESPGGVERRISDDKRTFGKEYFNEDKDTKDEK